MLCRKYGATGAYTPMLHSRLFAEGAKYREEHFSTCAQDTPLLVQFCGNDPDTLVQAAKLVEGHCDAIDLNLGCPQRIAKRGGYGAFLMNDLSLVEKLVATMVKELSVPVTCKIRIFPELERTLEYACMLERAQCSILAVHGRTRYQKDNTATRADWDAIRAIKRAVTIPVLANGNIRDLEDVDKCLKYTGVEGVLSAQSLLENPALFDERNTAQDGERQLLSGCKLLREYLHLASVHPVPQRMLKGHVYRLLGNWFREFTDIREQLNIDRSTTFEDCLAFLLELTDEIEKRIVKSGRSHPIPMIPEGKYLLIEQEDRRKRAKEEQEREEHGLAKIGMAVGSKIHILEDS